MSNTDCFHIKSIWPPEHDALIDGKAILTGMAAATEARFSYSLEGKIMLLFCDVYKACDRKKAWHNGKKVDKHDNKVFRTKYAHN